MRDDPALAPRGMLRGFAILCQGKAPGGLIFDEENEPRLFIKAKGTYSARLNPDNPLGAVLSLEHALRALDKLGAQEQERLARLESTLSDYRAQADKPFEHEARMKELLARQAELNAPLDLDKGERQVAEAAESEVASADVSPPLRPALPRGARAGVAVASL